MLTKMKKYAYIISLLVLPLIHAGCQEKVVEKYNDSDCLYFENATWGQKDSISHSFFILRESVVRDTVLVQVNTMGFASDKDRPIKLVQTNRDEEGAAIPGVHYVPFDDPEMQKNLVVKAGQAKVMVPVIFLRDPSMKKGEVRLWIGIEENEYFKTGIEKFQTFLVKSGDVAQKPDKWGSYWVYQFGEWGPVKMRFIIDYVGWSDFENPPDTGMRLYLQLKAREQLKLYNESHPGAPLCEDHDGTDECKNCVVFP